MARDKKQPEVKAGCPEWLATYGDLVTLVLTFFVLLFSFSTIDAQKWKDVVASLSGTPSIFDGLNVSNEPTADRMYQPIHIAEIDVEGLLEDSDVWDALVKEVENILTSNETVAGQAKMTSDAQQIKIDLSGDILFDSGSDVLKEGAADVILDVLEQLKPNLPLIGFFRIEGHTDNIPMRTAKFPSNWELSQGRAMSVLRFLFEMLKDDASYPPSMFNVGGYGEYHPVAGNDTLEGRALNRRVTFVIVKSSEINTNLPETVSPEDVPASTVVLPEELPESEALIPEELPVQ